MKDVTSLLNCIFLLSRSMTTDCEKFEQVQNWVQKLCTEKNIGKGMRDSPRVKTCLRGFPIR